MTVLATGNAGFTGSPHVRVAPASPNAAAKAAGGPGAVDYGRTRGLEEFPSAEGHPPGPARTEQTVPGGQHGIMRTFLASCSARDHG